MLCKAPYTPKLFKEKLLHIFKDAGVNTSIPLLARPIRAPLTRIPGDTSCFQTLPFHSSEPAPVSAFEFLQFPSCVGVPEESHHDQDTVTHTPTPTQSKQEKKVLLMQDPASHFRARSWDHLTHPSLPLSVFFLTCFPTAVAASSGRLISEVKSLSRISLLLCYRSEEPPSGTITELP